ncbi:hypothetical protein BC940DRAFT_331907 [Gongronella butleri]|nr:hypothetical protein BC940DRAFT_331907 [Gongronella butleri]
MAYTEKPNALLIAPGSVFSNVGALIVAELGVEDVYPIVPVDLYKGASNELEFLALNPLGKVPVLLHDGKAIPDSLDIAQFLEDTLGKDTLHARDPVVIDAVEQWRAWRISVLWYGKKTADQDTTQFEQNHAKVQERLALLKESHPEIYKTRSAAADERTSEFISHENYIRVRDGVNQLLDNTDKALAEHTYIVGNEPTLADIYATAFLFNHRKNTTEDFLENRPHLAAYLTRQLEKPTVKNTIK